MSQLSPERRKVVAIGGAIAATSGCVILFQKNHPWLTMVWIAVLAVAVVYVCMQLVKIKRDNAKRRSGLER